MCSCPLARWRHQSHQDKKPSFGMFIKPGARSFYNCFGCGPGSSEELIGALELYVPKEERGDYDFKLARALLHDELQVMPLPDFDAPDPKLKFTPWPLWWLDQYPPVTETPHAMEYLANRLVTPEEAVKQNLRFDAFKQMIVFPLVSVYGQFCGARGRSVLSGGLQHFDYSDKTNSNTRLVWYNEEALNLSGPVAVAEGQFDVLRLLKVWPKTVGNQTALPTEPKFQKLTESDSILHFRDNDETGAKSVVAFRKLATQFKVPYHEIKLHPSMKDPGKCPPQYLKNLIDSVLFS
jgi:DNA primase